MFLQVGPDGQIILDEGDAEEEETEAAEAAAADKENEEATAEEEDPQEESVPAPQVTISAEGEIVLNEARFDFHLLVLAVQKLPIQVFLVGK